MPHFITVKSKHFLQLYFVFVGQSLIIIRMILLLGKKNGKDKDNLIFFYLWDSKLEDLGGKPLDFLAEQKRLFFTVQELDVCGLSLIYCCGYSS